MKQDDLHTVNSLFSEWLAPPGDLTLSSDEVHVWRASLEMVPTQMKALKQILSADELIRADRFYFQKDRDHFIVAHGLLRLILSRYLEIEASELSFCYGPFGKPALEDETVKKLLRFNISHSHGFAIFAVTHKREIGVDLEYIRSDISSKEIAETFFSVREFDTLNALPEHKRLKAFFTLWTRKEAYLKARGKGLSGDLNNFDVTPASGNPAKLFEIHCFCTEGASWSLRDLDVEPEYAAALAVEGQECDLKLWSCN